MLKKIDWITLIIFILISQFAGIIGSIFTTSAIKNWYIYLNKPFFTPPPWLFAPVWLTLYTLMGVSAFLIQKHGKNKKDVGRALRIFYLQLALNALWSIIFFALKSPLFAFLEIIILVITIACMISSFYKINKTAAFLLVPYFLWSCLATALTLGILLLN